MSKRPIRRLADFVRASRGDMARPWQVALAHVEALFVDHGLLRWLRGNLHEVAPGMWRSAQPTPYQIGRLKRRGVKTVLNLRGARNCAAYLLQRRACARHGIALVDFAAITSRDVPALPALERLSEIFAEIEYPVLVHCKSGADRAGLVAALYLVQREGRGLDEAARQLGLRYGHFRQASTGILDHFLDAYRARAAREPVDLLVWARGEYDPEALRRDFRSRRWANILVDRLLERE